MTDNDVTLLPVAAVRCRGFSGRGVVVVKNDLFCVREQERGGTRGQDRRSSTGGGLLIKRSSERAKSRDAVHVIVAAESVSAATARAIIVVSRKLYVKHRPADL